jgi:uroporphyrinogen decarboxylase
MTPRERVLAVINHEEPDRVPIVLGVSNATGIKMKPYQDLKKILGIEAEDRYIYDWPELGTADPDEETMLRLHSDVRGVWDREPQSTMERNLAREPHSPCIDSWGSGQVEISPGEWFPGVHPMADATTLEEIESYPWPDMMDPTRVEGVREKAKRFADENQYAILATPWLLFPFERSFAMQGMDRFLGNMLRFPDFAQALMERIADLCKTLMGQFLQELDGNVDIIKIGDDLGMQQGLLISPDMYRQMLKPIHADFISFIKARTDAKVFFHSDGDIFDLTEDLVEIGVDILNPIQTSAGRMSDLSALKKRYDREVAFCGAIDTHRILPHGTPEEVRQEVPRVMGLLGPGGGYMVGAVHTIMNDVPAENILAMVDAVEEFGHYPLET